MFNDVITAITHTFLKAAAAEAAASPAIVTSNRTVHAFQAVKTDGGTPGVFAVLIEGTLDGITWVTVATLAVSGAIVPVSGIFYQLRATVSDLAAGDTVTVTYAGT